MRNRSVTGPLLLLLIGAFFLWRNLHPEAPLFDLAAQYWPFVLIVWGLLRLIEVFLFRQRAGWFSGGDVVLVVLICLIGWGMWEGRRHGLHYDMGTWVVGESYDYPVSAQAPAAGMKRVVFENPRGNLKVTGADTAQIMVNGHKQVRAWSRENADRANAVTPVEIVPENGRLVVRTNQDHTPNDERVSDDLEVTVPRSMEVETHGHSGDLDISGIDGGVDLESGHADVHLTQIGGNARLNIDGSNLIRAVDVKGTVDLDGRGSDVDLENVGGQVTIRGAYMGELEFKNLARPLEFQGALNTELRAQAVPGRLSLDRGEVSGSGVTGPVRLVTRSKDVKLEAFTQSLELETERGDVELQPSLPVPTIEARSGYGRIDLVLPEKAVFDLEATAQRGQAVNDFGPQIQKEVEGRTATLKGRVGSGPAIRIVANRGSVAVRKEGTAPSEIPDAEDAPAKPPAPPAPPKPPKEVEM